MFRKKFILLVSLIVLGLLMVACGGQAAPEMSAAPEENTAVQTDTTHEEAATDSTHTAVHWGYTGEGGPEHWADLDPAANAACKTGTAQSPIDIKGATGEDLADIVFNYGETAVNIFNNGHTVQIKYDTGSSIEFNGVTYNLDQFHFHAPSEHEINGELVAAEMHLVHKSANGAYAVVGVMIQVGAENPAFAPVWDNLPTSITETPTTIAGATINANDLLPDERTYYNYSGSFTTPPCTEGVTWLVLTTPIEMSAQQIADFKAIIGNNNRPVQDLNGRPLTEDTTSSN